MKLDSLVATGVLSVPAIITNRSTPFTGNCHFLQVSCSRIRQGKTNSSVIKKLEWICDQDAEATCCIELVFLQPVAENVKTYSIEASSG